MENVKSLDFKTLDCNCRRGICPYNKICRMPMVVYKGTCKNTKMSYIGNTQNHLKKRMQQHFGQVNEVLKTGKKSDTYADHFSEVWKNWGLLPSSLVHFYHVERKCFIYDENVRYEKLCPMRQGESGDC